MALSQTEGDFLTLHEFIQAAHKKLDRNMWDYLVGATATETTLLRNRLALDRIAFRPRVLRDVSSIDASHNFFGHATRLPVVLAPIGGLEALAEGGGISVARAAASFSVPFILSSVSEAGMQTVSEAANGTKIFQLYTRGDAAWVDGQIRQAMDLGYDAFCITVDSAVSRTMADESLTTVSARLTCCRKSCRRFQGVPRLSLMVASTAALTS